MARFGSNPEMLFYKKDSFAVRQAQLAAAASAADALGAHDLTAERESASIARIVSDHMIHVPVLDLENVSFSEEVRSTEQRSVFGDVFVHDVPFYVFDVPFTGERGVFYIKPSSFDMSPPYGSVHGDALQLEVRGPLEPDQIKREFDSAVKSVNRYLQWHETTWAGLADELGRSVAQAVSRKKQAMEASRSTSAGLAALGFKPK